MWDIVHFENRNGQCTISLKYLNFITQRLHVTLRPMSVLSISYELNYINIVKDLPCVDARTAFAYVFDAEPTRKYVSSRSLAVETQISSLLLGNMLDVVEEVQSAQLELPNLVRCTFCSESGGDDQTADLLEKVVYPEEISHCAAGVKWFKYLCMRLTISNSVGDLPDSAERGIQETDDKIEENEVIKKFHETVRTYFRGPLKPPFNEAARKAAGFGPHWYEPLAEKDVSLE